jgi:hypothetical protein
MKSQVCRHLGGVLRSASSFTRPTHSKVDAKLDALFKSTQLVATEEVEVTCTGCSSYGEAFGGTRRGQLSRDRCG